MSHCISSIVEGSRGFARPEQIIGPSFGGQNSEMIANMLTSSRHKRMNESSVTLTDSIVVDSTNRINTALAEHFQGPALLLEKLVALDELLSGKMAEMVLKVVRDSIGTGMETAESLSALGNVASSLEMMMDTIKNVVPDVSYFPLFEVRCLEFKELLLKQVRFLHTHIMEAIVEDNRNHMLTISTKYQEIANTLVAETADSAEL
jgi:hypothetical protein